MLANVEVLARQTWEKTNLTQQHGFSLNATIWMLFKTRGLIPKTVARTMRDKSGLHLCFIHSSCPQGEEKTGIRPFLTRGLAELGSAPQRRLCLNNTPELMNHGKVLPAWWFTAGQCVCCMVFSSISQSQCLADSLTLWLRLYTDCIKCPIPKGLHWLFGK